MNELWVIVLVVSGISFVLSVLGTIFINAYMCKKFMNKNQKILLRLSTVILVMSASARLLEIVSSSIAISNKKEHSGPLHIIDMFSSFINMNIGVIMNVVTAFIIYVFMNTTRLILNGIKINRGRSLVIFTVICSIILEIPIILTCVTYMLYKSDVITEFTEYASPYIGVSTIILSILLLSLNVSGSIVLKLIKTRKISSSVTTPRMNIPESNTPSSNNVGVSSSVQSSSPFRKTIILQVFITISSVLYFAGNIVILFDMYWNYLRLISLILHVIGIFMLVGTILVLYHPAFHKNSDVDDSSRSMSVAIPVPAIIITQH